MTLAQKIIETIEEYTEHTPLSEAEVWGYIELVKFFIFKRTLEK